MTGKRVPGFDRAQVKVSVMVLTDLKDNVVGHAWGQRAMYMYMW